MAKQSNWIGWKFCGTRVGGLGKHALLDFKIKWQETGPGAAVKHLATGKICKSFSASSTGQNLAIAWARLLRKLGDA